jgi:membrane dipeptidase
MKKNCISLFRLLFIAISYIALNNASAQPYKKIHNNAVVIDGHNDFFSYAMDSGYSFDLNLTGKTQSDLQRMKQGGIDAQVFCVSFDGNMKQPFSFAKRTIDSLYACVNRNRSKMKLVYTPEDLEQAVKQKKLGVMLGVEGGYMIEDDLNKLDSFYKLGVRYMAITWEDSPSWATSARDETKNTNPNFKKGLNDFGRQVIKRMNESGMMIDISHAGEQTFLDIINTSTKPIIASHSCVYNLSRHYRNLKDDQIKAIGKNNGLIMVTFVPHFLDSNWVKRIMAFDAQHKAEEDSVLKIKDDDNFLGRFIYSKYPRESELIDSVPMSVLIDHIDYIVKMIGVNHVGLGSDFDGMLDFPNLHQGLNGNGVLDYPKITEALLQRGYTETDIQKILGGNFIRVFKANMQ